MTFQITDIPRLLPELMLLALALLVLGTDVLERWGTDAQSQLERGKAAGQLTVIGLGFVFIVALVQSKFLFTVPEPATRNQPGAALPDHTWPQFAGRRAGRRADPGRVLHRHADDDRAA